MKLKTNLPPFSTKHLISQLAKASLIVLGMHVTLGHAEETTLGFHTVSYHNSGNYNDITPGIYLSKNDYVVGVYHNSIRNTSVYAGYIWNWPMPANPIVDAVSLTTGLVTGYRHKGYNSDVAPLVVTSFRHHIDNRHALRLSVLPMHKSSSATYVMHLSYEVKLNP